MGFLAPWFLAGIALAGLPLWLHLLRQFKRTPQPFSSLMFFERRVQSSTRHRRLKYITLLILRLALLLFVVFAFANPYVTRVLSGGGKRTITVIAIDRSFSMRAGNRLAQARADALRVVNGLGPRDMAQVLAFDSRVEAMTGLDSNRGSLTAAVDTVSATDLPSSYGEVARALRVLAETKGTLIKVHLFSDMQQSSMPANFRDLALGSGTSMEVHPAGRKTGNWAVQSVNTAARVFGSSNTKLDATVAGWSTDAASKKISLVLDGRTLDTKTVAIGPNGKASVQFLDFQVPYGRHRGAVVLNEGDELAQDDQYHFSVERLDPRPVLFLYSNGRARSGFYYRAALESSADTGLKVDFVALEQLGSRDLAPYAFVVLNDVGELDEGTANRLCAFVQHGGAALIVAGPTTVRAGRVPLTKAQLSVDPQTQGVGAVEDQSPALAGAGHFQNVQFYGATSITFKSGNHVLARLADGTPLLTEERMGDGRALFFSSTLDNTSNDFPLHASFLPFVAQTARYLSGTEEAMTGVVAGSPVNLRGSTDASAAVDVVGPEGKREIPLEQSAKLMSFDLVRDGFYEIGRAGTARKLIAVNADRRESDLTPIPNETLKLWRNTGGVGSAAAAAAAEVQPVSFWRYLLVLALFAALVESVFGSRYLRSSS